MSYQKGNKFIKFEDKMEGGKYNAIERTNKLQNKNLQLKRKYQNKQNMAINEQEYTNKQKDKFQCINKEKVLYLAKDSSPRQQNSKAKKYAYIKNRNSLVNQAKYEQLLNSYHEQENGDKQILRKRQNYQQRDDQCWQKINKHSQRSNNKIRSEQKSGRKQSYKKQDQKYKLQVQYEEQDRTYHGNQQDYMSKQQEIKYLKHCIKRQKQRFELFQQSTIENQIKILQTINTLQLKLKQLKTQNIQLNKLNTKLNQQNQSLKRQILSLKQNLNLSSPQQSNQPSNIIHFNDSFHPHFGKIQSKELYSSNLQTNSNLQNKFYQLSNQFSNLQLNHSKLQKQYLKIQTEYSKLQKEFKKIKGVGKGLVDMMKKVDNICCPQNQDQVKYAWKWLKKIVAQYQLIRKKAFKWKKAYDQLNRDSQNQQSISTQDIY